VRKWAELQNKHSNTSLPTTSLEFPNGGDGVSGDANNSSNVSGTTTTISINSAVNSIASNEMPKKGKRDKVRDAQHWFLFNDVFIHVKQRVVTCMTERSSEFSLLLFSLLVCYLFRYFLPLCFFFFDEPFSYFFFLLLLLFSFL
jgi:hypothetical protein